MSVLYDLQSYLKQKGIIQQDGVDCFIDNMPEKPDNVISLFEYEGTTDFVANRSVQIVVRDTSYETGRNRCIEAFNAVENPYNRITQLTEDRWAILKARQPVFKLKEDESSRTVWAFNLSVVTYND